MKYIQSANNPKIKQWKKLLTKKERDKIETYLIEGFHLVEEALLSDYLLEIIVSEGTDLPLSWNYGEIPVTMVTDEIIRSLSDTETPQGVLAICRQHQEDSQRIEGKKYLLIDSVQDPGNMGTIIRTADAAGIDAVIVGEGSVDIYNPKVLRAGQGSHFHLPIVRGNIMEWINKLKKAEIPVYGTALENGKVYTEVGSSEAFGLIVGNEGSGVKKEFLSETTANLYIPIFGKSESLNVAVAAGILLFYLKGQ